MRTLEFRNDGGRLAKQLLRLVDFSRGRNLQDTNIRVEVLDDGLVVSTFCTNEFGRELDNENHTRVTKENIPFFTLKKLGMV